MDETRQLLKVFGVAVTDFEAEAEKLKNAAERWPSFSRCRRKSAAKFPQSSRYPVSGVKKLVKRSTARVYFLDRSVPSHPSCRIFSLSRSQRPTRG